MASSRSTPASQRSASLSTTIARAAASARQEQTVFQLKELVDVEAGERMLNSVGMQRLRDKCEAHWSEIYDTVLLAKSLGGYVPVQYYMHEAQEGFGRLKSRVMVSGLHPIPYVRMSRAARATLASRFYWDVDMVNCQPRLLAQKLAQCSIPCPLLDRYNADRERCVKEVMDACGVSRDDAKTLFIRLLFLGSVQGWLKDLPNVRPTSVPEWVIELRRELRGVAARLADLPFLAQIKACYASRAVSFAEALPAHTGSDPLASTLAMYLQTLECDCAKALVNAIQADCRALGGIIYDGVLVQREESETALPDSLLRGWERQIKAATGFDVGLAVKPLVGDPDWLAPATPGRSFGSEHAWMSGRHMMGYDDMKARWEAHAFKVVRPGCYVIEDPRDGSRDVKLDKGLMDSYRHLAYAVVSIGDAGLVTARMYPFISRWIRDPLIRSYQDMAFKPPPLVADAGEYNIWDGFMVAKYVPPSDRPARADSPEVGELLDFVHTLCGRDAACSAYLLNWIAQLFQFPSKKTGIAILLKGEEGVGKNRFTDLLRAMLGGKGGNARFLQTASPATTLYGQFTRPREGKLLIVINEASGSDSFAANDRIKDMITCDDFMCEGKGANPYSIECFARFIFTSNNDTPVKVTPDSRRFVVIEASSELRGNTAYFNRLSALIDDAHVRYEFYLHLMGRDLSGINWINDRPVSESYMQMVSVSLPFEHQFIKSKVLSELRRRRSPGARSADLPSAVITIKSSDLFTEFSAWLVSVFTDGAPRYSTSVHKFGIKVSRLAWKPETASGFKGLTRKLSNKATLYVLDIAVLAREMEEKRWLCPDEVAALV